MKILNQGEGELFMPYKASEERINFKDKSRREINKLTRVKQAISNFVHDGDYIAIGGFGADRIPTALIHEIVRQGRKNLGLSGHTATHDCQLLAAGECFDRCDIAYIIGLEARGLSKVSRRYFESGKVKFTEWSNAALAWRYKAAAMGVSFLPTKVMMGTDTFKHSAAKQVECPFSGEQYALMPALAPDVALIHVHRADIYGNCQIDGINIADADLAKASRRVIITAEKIVDNDLIRQEPWKTIIPYWCVDAVAQVSFGSYPGNMEGEYFSDEDHLLQWMEAEKDPETFKQFMKKYIYDTKGFYDYLTLCGGLRRLNDLRYEELMVRPCTEE
ncbi:MAG: CoA transferase subunit A [Bdellovibrionales bacterium]|jgi:glutaconate CoA-transferase, subunit A|nr:CoA transferase subunit A [Bdellovibrionales bacterium]MBT3525494.1 CoA transferase subunit A [Bdellovibrionales bacterium]MBT7670407.1 CoA transferase subunit A [Bdellovibrionales bacterium]MBT7766755.1 CoA transferase subunit A [Bdellovibrionales bacterium]